MWFREGEAGSGFVAWCLNEAIERRAGITVEDNPHFLVFAFVFAGTIRRPDLHEHLLESKHRDNTPGFVRRLAFWRWARNRNKMEPTPIVKAASTAE